MTWDSLIGFMAHGGIKILIVGAAFAGHLMKSRAKQAAKERPPQQPLPGAMSSEMSAQTPRANGAKPVKNQDSPWSNSGDAFNGDRP